MKTKKHNYTLIAALLALSVASAPALAVNGTQKPPAPQEVPYSTGWTFIDDILNWFN